MKRKRSSQTIRTNSSSLPTPATTLTAPSGDAARSSSAEPLDPFKYHQRFVSAVLDVGTEYASPSQILDQMTLIHDPEFTDLKLEQIKSHLQRFRKVFFYHDIQRKTSTSTNNRGGYAKAMKKKSGGSRSSKSDEYREYDNAYDNASNCRNAEKKTFLDEYDNFVDFGLDAAAASLSSAENNYRSILGGRVIGLVSRMIMMDENVCFDGHQHFFSSSTADSSENNNQKINNRVGDRISIPMTILQSDTTIPKLTPEEKTSYLGRSIELVIGLLEHLNDHIHRERKRQHHHQGGHCNYDHRQQQRQQQQHMHMHMQLFDDAMATAMSIAASSIAGSASIPFEQQPIEGIPLMPIPTSTPTNKTDSVLAGTDASMVPIGQQQITPSIDKITKTQEKTKMKSTIPKASTTLPNPNQHMSRGLPPKLLSEHTSQRQQKETSATTQNIAFQKLQKVINDSLRTNNRRNNWKNKRTVEQLYRTWKRDTDDAVSCSDLSSLSSSSEDETNNTSNKKIPPSDGPSKLRDLNSKTIGNQHETHSLPLGKGTVFNSRQTKSWIFDSFPPPSTIHLICNHLAHNRQGDLSCEASTCSCCSSESSCQWVLTTNINNDNNNNNNNVFASHNQRLQQKDPEIHRQEEIAESYSARKLQLQKNEIENIRREDSCESDISSLGSETNDVVRNIRRGADAVDAAVSCGDKDIDNADDRKKTSVNFATLTGDFGQPIKFSFSTLDSSHDYHDMDHQVHSSKARERGRELLLRSHADERTAVSGNHLSEASTVGLARPLVQQQEHQYQYQPHLNQLQGSSVTSTPDRLGKFFPVKESDSNDDVSI
eukprot:jgi/Psemu1/11350/gm1.11350_g